MKFNLSDHVYKLQPHVLGNGESADPFFVMIKGISQNDFDEQIEAEVKIKMDNSPEEALKLTTKGTSTFLGKHVVGFENLFAGDKEIKTFEDCRTMAPREITTWIMNVVYSTEILMEREIKN